MQRYLHGTGSEPPTAKQTSHVELFERVLAPDNITSFRSHRSRFLAWMWCIWSGFVPRFRIDPAIRFIETSARSMKIICGSDSVFAFCDSPVLTLVSHETALFESRKGSSNSVWVCIDRSSDLCSSEGLISPSVEVRNHLFWCARALWQVAGFELVDTHRHETYLVCCRDQCTGVLPRCSC